MIIVFVPIEKFQKYINYKFYLNDRIQLIDNLKKSIVTSNSSEINHKNNNYIYYNYNKKIYVLFYWFHGMLGEDNGFLFTDDDQLLYKNQFEEFLTTSIISINKIDSNWYFIYCSRH